MDTARFLMACVLAATVLGGCTTTVQAPSSSLGKVTTAAVPEILPDAEQRARAGLGRSENSLDAEMTIEGEVSGACVHAWRTGLAGDKKGALAELDALSQKYPNVSTVSFMKGQVLAHFGDKEEAIKYYRQAATDKEFSAVRVFKLAEELRAVKRDKEAVIEYRRLLACQPDFVPGKVGLAKVLLDQDKSSAEAKKELESALSIEPKNKDAQELLHGLTQ